MRMTTEDWKKMAQQFDEHPAAAIGAILDLEDRLAALAVRLDNAGEHGTFNTRLEALRAAREHVNALPSEQPNARGYRDYAFTPEKRISEELRVAAYLLGEG